MQFLSGYQCKLRLLQILPRSARPIASKVYKQLRGMLRALGTRLRGQGWPTGHYHSPIPNLREVRARRDRIFSTTTKLDPSQNLNESNQIALAGELARFFPSFTWGRQPRPGQLYYCDNDRFTGHDALVLYAMMRRFAPRRIIEVGSGFSSALMLDISREFFADQTQLTFIEPYSARLQLLLNDRSSDRCTIIGAPVQDVPLTTFTDLEHGDWLFVDSSHVCKTGSDLHFLLFDVLPHLKPGVIVHFHDVLWPFEYPERWTLRLRWAWNEAYFLRAFLQYNCAFENLFFTGFVAQRIPEIFNASPQKLTDPHAISSLWLRRTDEGFDWKSAKKNHGNE